MMDGRHRLKNMRHIDDTALSAGTKAVRAAIGNITDWPAEIRRFRLVAGLKQSVLAELMSVDQATVSRWETGRAAPDRAIQRRLLALIRKTAPEECLLKHAVSTAMGEIVLSDRDRIILEASQSYAHGHGLSRSDLVGRSADRIFTEEGARLRLLIYEYGFYRGDVASVTVVAHAHTHGGACGARPTKAVWIPIRLTDGRVLMRAERVTLNEDQLLAERERNGGPIRIVPLDELAL